MRIRPVGEIIFHRLGLPRVDEKEFLGRVQESMNEGQASVLDVDVNGSTGLLVRQSTTDRSKTPAENTIVCSLAPQISSL